MRFSIAVLAVAVIAGGLGAAAADDDPVASAAWPDLASAYLGGAPMVYDDAVRLVMPDWVEEAFSVPIVVRLGAGMESASEVVVIAENNPIQMAAQVYPRRPLQAIGMNIRLEQSTPVRAAARDADGVWHVATQAVVVNAPGGCSTVPPGGEVAEIGDIALKTFERAGGASRLKVKIAHPMSTGFASDEAGAEIPAYYIDKVTLSDEDGPIADLVTWAALAADPVFIFDMPDRRQSVRVTAEDTRGLIFDSLGTAPSM